MALTEGKLGLTTRVKQELTTEAPNSVRKIQRWLSELPVIDLGASASQVFHLLFDLNQSEFNPKERIRLLEATRETCQELISSLTETYIHSPLIHVPKLRSASELVHALASEQVFGYNQVIEDIMADQSALEQYEETILPAACANALLGQGLIQLQRYQLYKTVGNKVWQQQNIIYLLSKQHGFFELPLKKETASLHSVKHQLLRNIALSTCNPYQMKHGEVNEAYQVLDQLAPLTDLQKSVDANCLYAYSAEKNIAPQPTNAIDADPEDWLGVDLTAAISALQNSAIPNNDGLFAVFKKDTQLDLSEDLKIHILDHWRSIKGRNFIRVNSEVSTKAAIGMAASHNFLVERAGSELRERFFGKAKPAKPFQASSDLQFENDDDSQHAFVWQRENTFGAGQSNKPKTDAFDSIYKPRSYEDLKVEKEDKPFKEFKTKTKYQWVKGLIKDVSPAGFCLAFEESPSKHVESNELVTVQNYKNGEMQYNLGLIRWNLWQDNETFLIGVELISPEASPIRATLDWDYAKPTYHHNGLLLPEMPNIGIDASIILPPMGYRSGQTVSIMTADKEYKIELTKAVLQTSNFIQFHYQAKEIEPQQ